jgi:hypothetical protein
MVTTSQAVAQQYSVCTFSFPWHCNFLNLAILTTLHKTINHKALNILHSALNLPLLQ